MELEYAKRMFEYNDNSTTTSELKAKFRKLSFICHPDTGGKEEQFKELAEAYVMLLDVTHTVWTEKDETVDFIPLLNLGKGYPITVSANTCDICDGAGYKTFHETKNIRTTCPSCDGAKLVRHPCRSCSGLGYYRNPRTNKNVGECEMCHGSGWFYPQGKRTRWFESGVFIPGTFRNGIECSTCSGRGTVVDYTEIECKYHVKCDACDGVGEIRIWNPVIPRGLFNK